MVALRRCSLVQSVIRSCRYRTINYLCHTSSNVCDTERFTDSANTRVTSRISGWSRPCKADERRMAGNSGTQMGRLTWNSDNLVAWPSPMCLLSTECPSVWIICCQEANDAGNSWVVAECQSQKVPEHYFGHFRSSKHRADGLAASAAAVTLVTWCGHTDGRLWPGGRQRSAPTAGVIVMAAYRRVYDSHHLQADCQAPGSAPEPYAR